MKKYLGSYINVIVAIISPIFIVGTIIFGLCALSDEVMPITIIIFLFCSTSAIYFLICLIRVSDQFYSWGIFEKTKVRVKSLFHKEYELEYRRCNDVGIGCYIQGRNSGSGLIVGWIYLSYYRISEKDKVNINMLRPSKNFIKLRYSRKTCDKLIEILPSTQACMLKIARMNVVKMRKKQ